MHGIGSQPQGATAAAWADALSCWLSRWFLRDPEARPAVATAGPAEPVLVWSATLHPADETPAHAIVEVGSAEGAGRSRSWVIAEAWWAEAFDPPAFRAVAVWLLTVVPSLLLLQFGTVLRRAWGAAAARVPRVLVALVLLLLVTPPLAGLAALAVLLISCFRSSRSLGRVPSRRNGACSWHEFLATASSLFKARHSSLRLSRSCRSGRSGCQRRRSRLL